MGKLRAARRGGGQRRRKECTETLWVGRQGSSRGLQGLLRDASDQGTAVMGVGEIGNTRKCLCRVERTKINRYVYFLHRVRTRASQRLQKPQVASRWFVSRLG